jgi:hypothetical protein
MSDIYRSIETQKSFGWKLKLGVDKIGVAHGYSTRSLANDTTKAYGQVYIRCSKAATGYAVGDYMVDSDGTTINGVFMTAPLAPYNKKLVYTVYPGSGEQEGSSDPEEVEWQVELKGYFFDPDDAAKKIYFHEFDYITTRSSKVRS